jgi:hypothetical protein
VLHLYDLIFSISAVRCAFFPLFLFFLFFLIFILVRLYSFTMAPSWMTKACPKVKDRTHESIHEENPDSSFCSFCGRPWPDPITVHDSEDDIRYVSRAPRTKAQVDTRGHQLWGPERPQKRDRTSNLIRKFKTSALEAAKESRGSKETQPDPYDHPIGLQIRLVPLLTIGEMQSGFFIPGKVTKLSAYDLYYF